MTVVLLVECSVAYWARSSVGLTAEQKAAWMAGCSEFERVDTKAGYLAGHWAAHSAAKMAASMAESSAENSAN